MPVVEDAARSIFFGTLELPEDQWDSFLQESCGADDELRGRVDDLLRAHGSMANIQAASTPKPSFLNEPELGLEGPGAVLGSYRLLEKIGEGGFGIVYMAEQTQPVRRKVALKILKPGMDTRQVVARFEAERQALALMDHPNIAQVFDGGTTATGRPFFVMELVRGIPITEFCDQDQLSVRQRIDLVLAVCQAVQHAHQKGIIHRDLKPSNVMVTMHDVMPVVKVIDFGIAKAVGQQLTEKTLFTNFSQMIGTPPYMSPEQAQMSGLDIDTRSDIYALGVLLYELLTGMPPFDRERLRTVAFDEIRRIIREEQPPKPSTRLSSLSEATTTASRNRGSDPHKLCQLLRGELDWIVMKCLEKDRNRRYETASGLAMDLRRYLKNEPVHACPPSVSYRVQVFCRRYKASLTTAALFLVLILVGSSLTVWQAIRAASARHNEIRAELELSSAHERAAEARVREMAHDLETLNTANRLIESGSAHAENGEWAQAEADLSEAVKLRPDHSQVWYNRGALYGRLSLWGLAAADFQSSYKLNELGTANSLYLHALLRLYTGDTDAYRAACKRMIERFGQNTDPWSCEELSRACLLVEDPVMDPNQIVKLAQTAVSASRTASRLTNLATAEYRAGQYENALEHIAQARVANPRWETTWQDSIMAMAQHRLGQSDAAKKSLASAADAMGKRFQTRLSLPTTYNTALWPLEAQAELHFREAKHLIEGVEPLDDFRLWLVQGESLATMNRQDEAIARFDRAVELNPSATSAWSRRANYFARLSNWERAISDYEKLLLLQPKSAVVNNNLAWFLAACPDTKYRDPKRAVELTKKAIAITPSPNYWNTLAVALYRNGEWSESMKMSLKSMESRQTDDAWDWFLLAMAQWQLGQKEQARQLFTNALRRLDVVNTPQNEELERFRDEAAALIGLPAKLPSEPEGAFLSDPVAYGLLLEINPNSFWARLRRGNAYAKRKQWDKSSADFEQATETQPTNAYCWYGQAASRLGANDLEGYRNVRAKMLVQMNKSKNVDSTTHVLYSCIVLPANTSEIETMLRWGELSVKGSTSSRARGAAKYRAGKFQETIADLEESAKIFPPRGWDWLFLAMAHHQLGHVQLSKAYLDKAGEWIDRTNRNRLSGSSDPWISWPEPIEVDYLLREAKSMILR